MAITDLPGTWLGTVFECKGGYFDISGYGNAWNVVGSYYHYFRLPGAMLWFMGVNTGYGFNGLTLTKSRNRVTGESRIVRREVDEGFSLGVNGGFGFHF